MRGLQALPGRRGGRLSEAPIAARLAAILDEIARAADRGQRDPAEVALVGASKTQPSELLLAAYAAGLRRFGENRVQEAITKRSALPTDIEWHLLGPLQSNKARSAVRNFARVHAIDRPEIAETVDREAAKAGVRVAGLVEVNLGNEATKHGFAPAALVAASERLAAYAHLEIDGLMAIPPPESDQERARSWFRALRALRDELAARPEWRGRMRHLSMGMSADFALAVEEGATFVRVGSALFGARSPDRAPLAGSLAERERAGVLPSLDRRGPETRR